MVATGDLCRVCRVKCVLPFYTAFFAFDRNNVALRFKKVAQ